MAGSGHCGLFIVSSVNERGRETAAPATGVSATARAARHQDRGLVAPPLARPSVCQVAELCVGAVGVGGLARLRSQ